MPIRIRYNGGEWKLTEIAMLDTQQPWCVHSLGNDGVTEATAFSKGENNLDLALEYAEKRLAQRAKGDVWLINELVRVPDDQAEASAAPVGISVGK